MYEVEKDAIQSMFLKRIAASELPFVFKGGTALSKAFGIINRFSEDIDLTMSERPSESKRIKSKELIIEAAEEIGLKWMSPDEIWANGKHNIYEFSYDSLFQGRSCGLLVETSYHQAAHPIVSRNIGSYIEDALKKANSSALDIFDAAGINMSVQSLERTLIDKTFAVCDYYLKNKPERNSRHLYDIAKLVSAISFSDGMKDLVDYVRNDRFGIKGNLSADSKYDIVSLLNEIMESRFFEDDYVNVTQASLLYEDMPYDEAIENGIAVITRAGWFDPGKKALEKLSPKKPTEKASAVTMPEIYEQSYIGWDDTNEAQEKAEMPTKADGAEIPDSINAASVQDKGDDEELEW